MNESPVEILVHRLDPEVPLPTYQTEGSAGMDLCARSAVNLQPGERAVVPTGLRLAIPRGYEAQVRPRSGLAIDTGITVLNAPGTIDSDYRGEIGVILVNLGRESVTLPRHTRIAQLVVAPIGVVQLREVATTELPESDRGTGGFGSTGLS